MPLSKTHQGQHFDQAAKSYDILMRRRDLCWMVTIKPSRPGLPVFQRHSFKTATQSERYAASSLNVWGATLQATAQQLQ
jgi:hypothetical protein